MSTNKLFNNLKQFAMEIQAIKPGPKPKKEDGTPDRRPRVNPPNKEKHPELKPHKHKPRCLKEVVLAL